MKTVLFATSNRGKAKEVKRIMKKLNVKIIPLDLHEDKTLSHEQLVVRKAWDAFEKTGKPVVVEDTGLFVEGFKGYPGLNSKG
ncbi:MAG TPA: non-canonical purine NTP pyrophosphatase, partial [Candidatus Norongarragalinales archaeon]|nr:non-canonical purine NTP pyrophosphatase [Candidatus Norongarragalinales archaeon]